MKSTYSNYTSCATYPVTHLTDALDPGWVGRKCVWRECMGIEPTQPDVVRSRTVLKTVRATRLHPLPRPTQARDRISASPRSRRPRLLPGRGKGTPRLDLRGPRRGDLRTSADRRATRVTWQKYHPNRPSIRDTSHCVRLHRSEFRRP